MTHPMKQVPDMISTTGKFVNMSSGIPPPENASNGDWYYNNATKQLTYLVSGKGGGGLVDRSIKMTVSMLFCRLSLMPVLFGCAFLFVIYSFLVIQLTLFSFYFSEDFVYSSRFA